MICKLSNKKGFTLVELLIVIAVLGIISTVGISSMSGLLENVKLDADKLTAQEIVRQVEYLVMIGKVDETTKAVPGIDYPLSQTNNVKLIADVEFVSKEKGCLVTVYDSHGFTYTEAIEGKIME